MKLHVSLRFGLHLVFAGLFAGLLANCTRIDATGKPVNKPAEVVGTHVSPANAPATAPHGDR